MGEQLAPFGEAADAGFSAETYRMLIEGAHVAVFVAEPRRFLFVNDKLCRLMGYSRAELLGGVEPIQLVAPQDRAFAAAQNRERLSGIDGHPGTIRCQHKDGRTFSARAWSSPITVNGKPANLVTLQDISELERVITAEQRRSKLLALTEELALIGSSEYDVSTGLVTQSAGMFRVFGEPVREGPVDGEWLMERVPASEAGFVRGILAGVRSGVPCEFEHRIQHRDGSVRTVVHRAMAEVDAAGNAVRVIGILQDITAQRAAEKQRDLLARCDLVTRLPNRPALVDHVDETIRQAVREHRCIALLKVEIGQLQLVSESLGHAAGDRLQVLVSERLATCIPVEGMLAHVGSGRFVVVLSRRTESVDEAAATATSAALIAAFETPFEIEGTEVFVHCAIGMSVCPRDSDDAEKLLHQAEAAMRRAQEQGGSRLCVYAFEAHAKAATRLVMEAALRRALEREEFHLVYQPQMDLATGSMIGVEALLRWSDPARGLVSPADFIPLAEETGLILPIGEWVLREACAQNAAWQRAGLPTVRMAVNLSVRQLQQPGIAGRVERIMMETGLAPRYLGVEITESMLMEERADVARTLTALREMGVEISLDDFGTGYSNLSYLGTLPIDVVKVDRSFVHDVTAAPQHVSMTRAVITLAHSLQMKVIAEGVETEGQLALLIANRCDQMQGYFFSRPVSPKEIAELLRERRQLPAHLLQQRTPPRGRREETVEDADMVALPR